MLERLYEMLTGRPYWSERSAAPEFGPTPGAEIGAVLTRFSDAELVRMDRADLLQLVRARAQREMAA